ncbi:hypothetical protein P691DRAFT_806305 [Macrolepiota fuliginosa MF-IS2]|uniref:F-box domain-containing protein n=1 Tax=Macrolepiota fuliginosa MF-IS2 TaxID=1400762 RepID=A0A9P5XMM3_9AGAR|nr:hypothetical protein P691DRAFT_806305 [Macrolepiota fuliginosa MF-IS2]
MAPSALSKYHKQASPLKYPRKPFHLDSAYIHYDRLQELQKSKPLRPFRKECSLSLFTSMPLDLLYEVCTYLHPQDALNLARSTRRLRQLLMTRDARFVWKSVLSNVEGLPSCPSDLTEPQFANLAFDGHCHLCLAPRVKDVYWSCRVRCCKKCLPKCFLTMDQLRPLLQKIPDIPRPETIFKYTLYPKSSPDRIGMVLFYKPTVEAYLRELAEVANKDEPSLTQWCRTKRAILDEIMAHAALCEHWTSYWAHLDTTHQFYDFGFTLFLLGLLMFLWKDKLFY